MDRLDGSDGAALGGVASSDHLEARPSRPQCARCQRFARLLPGETECARCSGVLALEFGEITTTSDAIMRGGW